MDWPLDYSKIKLRDTILKELKAIFPQPESKEFLVDVFKLDNKLPNRFFCILVNMFVQKVLLWLSVVVKNL